MSDISVTTLDLLRHGACNDDCHLRGHTDSVVSEKGWQQMVQAVSHWPHAEQWQVVLTSPLQRCQVFAEKLAALKNLGCYTLEPLREMSFGRWDGMTLAELQQEGDDYLAFWQAPEHNSPPDGECLQDFQQRVHTALQQIVRLHRGQHCLAVTHAGVIRAMIGAVLQLPLSHLNRLQVGYGAFAQLQVFHHPEHPDWYQLTHLRPQGLH
jgi:alpha-ribazole phosphatase